MQKYNKLFIYANILKTFLYFFFPKCIFSCTAGAILALYAPYPPLAFFSILFLVFLFLVSLFPCFLVPCPLSLVPCFLVPCFLFPFPLPLHLPRPSRPLLRCTLSPAVRLHQRPTGYAGILPAVVMSAVAFDLRLSTFD